MAHPASFPVGYPSTHTSSNVAAAASPAENSLLARRQQTAPYLQPLELRSLPPLSHILTEQNRGKGNPSNSDVTSTAMAAAAVAAEVQKQQQQQQQQQQMAAPPLPPPTATTLPLTTSQPMTQNSLYPSQPIYYGDYALAHSQPTSTQPTDPLLPSASLVTANPSSTTPAPSATAAPAVPSATIFPTTNPMLVEQSFTPMPQPMLPIDTTAMFSNNGDPSTAAGVAAAAAAAAAAAGYMRPTDDTRRVRQTSVSSTSSDKIYSFVAIPGTNQKKRPRRRYDEIERLYHCNWPGCTKAYGTLNHLNAHVSMQKHGPKRHPTEFKEMRKEWRRQKKEREAAKKAAEEAMKQHQQQSNHHHHHQQQQPTQHVQHSATVMPPPPYPPTQFQSYPPLQHTMTMGTFY